MIETEKLILAIETTGLATTNQALDSLNKATQTTQETMDAAAQAADRAKVKIHDFATEVKITSAQEVEAAEQATVAINKKTAAWEKRWGISQTRYAEMMSDDFNHSDEVAAVEQISAEEERRNSIIQQRTAIKETQVQIAEAEAAQQGEMVEFLSTELKILQAQLSLRQSTLVSEEEAFALAERRVTAEAVVLQTKQAQAQLDARLIAEEQEKLNLERMQVAAQAAFNAELVAEETIRQRAEASSGRIYGRGGMLTNTLRNVGVDENMSKAIGIATIGALALDRVIDGIGKHYDEQRLQVVKNSHELERQLETWQKMTATAKDMTDVLKLHESIANKLGDMRAKQDEAPMIKGTIQTLSDGLQLLGNMAEKVIFRGMPEVDKMDDDAGTSWKAEADHISKAIADYEKFGEVMARQAETHATLYKELQSGNLNEQVDKLMAEQAKLQGKLDGAFKYSKSWVEYKEQLDEITKSLERTKTAQEHLNDQNLKLSEEFQEAQREGAGDSFDKVAAYQAKIESIKAQLANQFGQAIETSADAFDKASGVGVGDKERIAVEKLAIEWQKLSNLIATEHKRESAEAQKGLEEAEQEQKKEDQRLQLRKDTLETLEGETQVLEEQAKGHDAVAKKLQLQLQYEREIDKLRKEGILDTETEAAAQGKLNAALDKERHDRMQKQEKVNDQLAIDIAGAGKSKTAKRNASVNKMVDDKRREFEDSDMSQDEIDQQLDAYRKAIDHDQMRKQGRLGGDATPSPFNRELGLTDADDWKNKFHKTPNIESDKDPGIFSEDTGSTIDRANDMRPGPGQGGIGSPSVSGISGASNQLQSATKELSAAAASISSTAGAVKQVSNSLSQLGTALQGMEAQINNLTATVTQMQSDLVGA